MQTPEYLARNPYGKMPVLTTADGTSIFESRAIVKYLARNYGFSLLPDLSDPLAAAAFDQAEMAEMLYFSVHMDRIGFERYFKKVIGSEPDEAAVAAAKTAVEQHLDLCEIELGKPGHEYMAGSTFGLIDIYYVPNFARLKPLDVLDLLDNRPNVKAWWDRCSGRPAVAKVIEGTLMVDELQAVIEKLNAGNSWRGIELMGALGTSR
jgi:glutathione S-transferase